MPTASTPRVDVHTGREWLTRPDRARVIDVRSPAEFETVHIDGAINVPLPLLEQHTQRLAGTGTGAEQAQVLDSGLAAYIADGGDVVRGRARWSLERQVRLGAGTLVTAGLLAGRIPTARLLAAGLIIFALTDTCVMGRALSKLPYNSGAADPDPADVIAQLTAAPNPA